MVRPPPGQPPPRTPRRRAPAPRPERRRSQAGRIAAAALAVAAATGVGSGLNLSGHHPPTLTAAGPSCGGVERWNVKVANDPDAAAIDPNPRAATIGEMNALLPGPVDQGGRMQVEKAQYTVKGYLSFFKHEADGDYHVVLTDETGVYSKGKAAPNGHSMVVEFPDLDCLSGKAGQGAKTSQLAPAMGEALAVFESRAAHLHGSSIPPKSIAVTVTGVGFFDFDHGQVGRAVPHPGVDGQQKVIELHPVTAISFDNLGEID
nr:hypothetical protein [Phenylobacterium sp.]